MRRALDSVNEKILTAVQKRQPDIIRESKSHLPRLVAVSKLKPASAIIEAYECGQRYFGENYIQELEEKSNLPELLSKCPEIKFHFIGHLQSNKVNKLLKVRNLHMIETIDSIKLADSINKAIERHRNGKVTTSSGDDDDISDEHAQNKSTDRLKVMIQVNTSGEEQKNGLAPEETALLAEHIVQRCRWLELAGLMTIGKLDGWEDDGPNKDFVRLHEIRKVVAKHLSVEPKSLELSMGMSSDFEEAITLGSTNVRVGSMIFGVRDPKH